MPDETADGLHGLSGHYWEIQRAFWKRTAYICRYGGQDVYRILGRDPIAKPLSPWQLTLFQLALADLLHDEFSPREETSDNDDLPTIAPVEDNAEPDPSFLGDHRGGAR